MTEFHTGVLAHMASANETLLVFITVPSAEVAEDLAHRAVEARLAACVNIVPGVRSVYRWEEKICTEGELLLIAKTTPGRVLELEAFIKQHHPYDTPEFISIQADRVEQRYGAWIHGAVA